MGMARRWEREMKIARRQNRGVVRRSLLPESVRVSAVNSNQYQGGESLIVTKHAEKQRARRRRSLIFLLRGIRRSHRTEPHTLLQAGGTPAPATNIYGLAWGDVACHVPPAQRMGWKTSALYCRDHDRLPPQFLYKHIPNMAGDAFVPHAMMGASPARVFHGSIFPCQIA